MWGANLEAFRYIFIGAGGSEGIRAFWETVKNEPWVQHHPGFALGVELDTGMIIPWGGHGDKGVQVKRDKLLSVSWGSTTSRAPTIWRYILYSVIPDEVLIKNVSDEELYAVWVWSAYWLMRGVFPSTDPYGKPWPTKSRRAALVGKPLASGSGGVSASTCVREWRDMLALCSHM